MDSNRPVVSWKGPVSQKTQELRERERKRERERERERDVEKNTNRKDVRDRYVDGWEVNFSSQKISLRRVKYIYSTVLCFRLVFSFYVKSPRTCREIPHKKGVRRLFGGKCMILMYIHCHTFYFIIPHIFGKIIYQSLIQSLTYVFFITLYWNPFALPDFLAHPSIYLSIYLM